MDEWVAVEECARLAEAIAFDECHKIYVAMDGHEADFFTESAYEVFRGGTADLVGKLREWYFEKSCDLRFISAVRFDGNQGERVFVALIPQRFKVQTI